MQKYDVTKQLKFRGNPKLVINGEELTVRADAKTMIRLMTVIKEKGEAEGAVEAVGILFSKGDQKKLDALNLQLEDFIVVVRAAVELAMGVDPAAGEDPA